MSKKQMLMGLAGAMSLGFATIAVAEEAEPANYEDAAREYIDERLTTPSGARYRFTSEPYQVTGALPGYEDLEGWAVDVRVKARMPNGRYGGYLPYTVFFYEGQAVALSDDMSGFERL